VPESALAHRDLGVPFGLTAADLHGSGLLDLIATDQVTGELIVFEHGTPGRFAALPDVQVGTSDTTDRPVSLAGGDLDGNGLLDLVSANETNRNLAVFLQESPGRFAETPDSVLAAGRAMSVACADLDGDADLELLSANFGEDTVLVFEQLGPGLFTVPPVALGSTRSSNGAQFVAAADLDGDGAIDVVSANRLTTVTVFLNATFRDAAGAFVHAEPDLELGSRARPRALALADLEPDGDLDLVSANEVTSNLIVFRNQGPEGFRADVPLGGQKSTPDPRAVVAADLDADGLVDIASANHGMGQIEAGSVRVFFQDAGRFDSPPLFLRSGLERSLAATDLDLDGDLDLVSAQSQDVVLAGTPTVSDVGLFSQTSPRRFNLGVLRQPDLGNPAFSPRPVFVSAADWNSDGEVDLAVALHVSFRLDQFAISDKIGFFFNGK
jgi:hypothetical protein